MHIEVFEGDGVGNWYWRFRGKGRITADAESFPTKGNAVRAAKAVVTGVKEVHGYTLPEFSKTLWDAKRECFVITWG